MKKSNDKNMMPNGFEIEQEMLFCIMYNNDIVHDYMVKLNEDYFYSKPHKLIFKACKELFKEHKDINYNTVIDKLKSMNVIDQAGGVEYIAELMASFTSVAMHSTIFKILQEYYYKRTLLNTANEIIQKTVEDDADVFDSIRYAESLVFNIGQSLQDSKLEHIDQFTKGLLEKTNQIIKNEYKTDVLNTGFFAFDKLTKGLKPADLVLLAARPSVGKTAFALNIATNVATNYKNSSEKKVVALFSLEMSSEQILNRLVTSITEQPMLRFLANEITQNTNMVNKISTKIFEAVEILENTKLYIDDSSLNTPLEILSKCRRLAQQTENKKIDLIIIDYLQLMMKNSSSRANNRQEEVAENSRYLKLLAKEMNAPVIALSQLSREIDKRKDKEPILSDLRESGAIEQDADIVMFLHRPEGVDRSKEHEIELHVLKHRNGPTGKIKFLWTPEKLKFSNLKYANVADDKKQEPLKESSEVKKPGTLKPSKEQKQVFKESSNVKEEEGDLPF